MTESAESRWMEVVAKSLAFLCLAHVEKEDPTRVRGLVSKVKFLQGLGLSQPDAAEAVGSTPASVAEMLRQAKKKGSKGGQKKKSR